MTLRRVLPLLAVCACVVAAVVAGVFAVLGAGGDGGDRSGTDGAETADAPSDSAVPDDASRLVDASGGLLRMPDGQPFPPGSRRSGRRVVTPDGRVFVRERGGGAWREVRADDVGAPGAPAPPPPPVRPPPGVVGARPAPRPPTLRPPVWDGVPGTPGESAAPRDGGDASRETLINTGSGVPDLRTRRTPERRIRTDDEQARARDEERAVVARQGLRGDYFDFVSGRLHTIPDLATLPPTFSRIDLRLDFSRDEDFHLPFEPETFAVLWRGQLIVPGDGEYRFTCGSDDGVRLVIGDETVLEYTGLRPYAETSGAIRLSAGRHPIEVTFYENEVYASCRLFWQGPSLARQIVPSENLTPPDDVADVIQPHVTSVQPPSARVGDEVVLRGVGFADAPPLNRVTFAGVPAEVVEASANMLRVIVPVGGETGDVVVQVGPLSSLPRGFEAENVNGLYAEYFLIGEDLHDHPDLTTRTPYFVRLDGPLDFHQDGLWNLPYEPDVFATRLTGYLYVPVEDDIEITLGSDDGTRVEIDGQTFIDDPGLHAYRERSRTVRFAAGFHPIRIQFFENRGVARLRLFWKRSGDVTRAPIPRGFLFPPEQVVDRPEPRLARGRVAAGVGELLELSGSGLGHDLSLVRVLFPGDVWVRPERVAGDSLSVLVPDGAGTGTLRVHVGISSTNGVQFERTTPEGFRARYYVFSSEAEMRAAASPEVLAERASHLTRIETRLDRSKAEHWDLPFPYRNAALHLSGKFSTPLARRIGFLAQAADGVLLVVDGRPVLSDPPSHDLRERSAVVDLAPGEHTLDLYHFQGAGQAVLRLFWTPYGLAEHRDVPARWFRPAE